MSRSLDRREFLKRAAAAGTAVAAPAFLQSAPAAQPPRQSANDRLNLAIIGVTGRGGNNLSAVKHENIAVLCDVDARHLAKAAAEFPQARQLADCRRIFDQPNLDGVVISTPDHMHAIPIALALRAGLPVYCEKPLTHSVYEARVVRQLAAQAGVATQMGNQIHSSPNYRRVVEIVRSGAIGPIERVHVWLVGTIVAGPRATEGTPPPEVDYDLWLGPAPYRPYHPAHFHFNWRYWWDFGGGQLADFGCHYMDLPVWALDLHAPTTVAAKGEPTSEGDNDCPAKMQVEYQFPARGEMPPVHLTWYHGGWMPEGAESYDKKSAVLFEGANGRLLADYSTHKLFLEAGGEAAPVKPWITDSVGHHQEWLDAIRSGGPTASNFGYGAELTETVLLGNVAYRSGRTIQWDAQALRTDSSDADQYLHREYREPWTL